MFSFFHIFLKISSKDRTVPCFNCRYLIKNITYVLFSPSSYTATSHLLPRTIYSKMTPPSAYHDGLETGASVHANGNDTPGIAPHEPGLSKQQVAKHEIKMQMPTRRAVEKDPYKEREYQKGRLVLAFRLFAKYGFDEGVAGHITLRVRNFPSRHLNTSNKLTLTGSCRTR